MPIKRYDNAMRSGFRFLAVLLLSLCFGVSINAAAYASCTMSQANSTLSDTGCVGMASDIQHKCCVEMLCIKCFSLPSAFLKADVNDAILVTGKELFPVAIALKSQLHTKLERPPKA